MQKNISEIKVNENIKVQIIYRFMLYLMMMVPFIMIVQTKIRVVHLILHNKTCNLHKSTPEDIRRYEHTTNNNNNVYLIKRPYYIISGLDMKL